MLHSWIEDILGILVGFDLPLLVLCVVRCHVLLMLHSWTEDILGILVRFDPPLLVLCVVCLGRFWN